MYPESGPLPCTEVKTSRRTSFSLPLKGKMQNANAKLPTYHGICGEKRVRGGEIGPETCADWSLTGGAGGSGWWGV
ncbi:hypothetical protein GOBAR_DD22099 [Gossypium barbadense]|nr:hypothetical protein GOBAR_DD22099 [Gossypium barbadense]